jgi:aminomethyltransferase
VGLCLDGTRAPEHGARILHATDEVGTVTSGVFSPALARAIAMGYVRREVMEPGSRLMIEVGSESIPAEVVRLPFVTGED